MFDAQITQHFELLYSVRGREATLARGDSSCDLRVILGRSNNSALFKENMKFEADCQDFICLAVDYKPGGLLVEPAADDTIAVEIAGRLCTFEVRPASDTEQVFSADATGTEYRIKTKLVDKSS